jgi:hypothetical protein
MRKPVWDVLHISEENRVLIVKGKIHHYTNDQFFLCPDCPGTAYLGDETLAYGTTAMCNNNSDTNTINLNNIKKKQKSK